MKLNIQRAIDRIAGTFICRLLSAVPRKQEKPSVGQSPRKVLVILLSEMGSLVLGYPMFRRIKKKYPDATIHVLLFEKNREILEILGVVPRDHILTISVASLWRFALDSLGLLVTMRKLKFDAVIDCELFARISSIFSYLSGANIRVGFFPYTQEGLYRGSFINRRVLYNPYQHISQQFLTLVEAVDSSTVPKAKRTPENLSVELPSYSIDPKEIQEMSARLCLDFPVCQDRKLVLIYPSGGVLPIRAWPLENYSKLSEALLADGYVVGIIGLKNDKALAGELIAGCGSSSCIDLTGYTQSVKELLMLFSHAALLITNDGGPGQFAPLTPIPTIIFYGPETPVLYGSLGRNAYFFYLSFSCSPCLTAYNHRNSPCDGDNQCLKNIDPDRVYAKAREMLAIGMA